MTTLKALAILALSGVLLACGAAGTNSKRPSILNAELARAWGDIENASRTLRPEIRFVSGKTARNCDEYLQQLSTSQVDEGINNRGTQQAYLVCETIALLSGASASAEHPETNTVGAAILTRLDLTSFNSSLRQLAQTMAKPYLGTLDSMTVNADAHSVTAESDDWRYHLEIVAVADIDSSGKDDWIVWLSDTARDGNYRDHAVLVIENPPLRGGLRARRFPLPVTR